MVPFMKGPIAPFVAMLEFCIASHRRLVVEWPRSDLPALTAAGQAPIDVEPLKAKADAVAGRRPAVG
jgi:hypothetical protein